MQSRGSGAGIKACGSGTQCHRAGGAAPGRGSGERGFQVTLALLLPPLSLQLCHISPPPLLPSSMPLMLSFPSIPPARPAAVGCTVGPWGPWSRCSSPCGVGSKARSRQVTVPPQHGGEPCPDLKQRRGCLGEHPTCGTAKEVAKILPDSFSRDFRDPWRRAGRLLLEEPSGWARCATGGPGAAACAGTSRCVSSAGGARPTAGPTASGMGCKEPGRFGWPPRCWGARARGCRRGCGRAVPAPRRLSSLCSPPRKARCSPLELTARIFH
ncbi:SCO-spondin-like isoform X1 [Falco rusticolus]|uniref:SCO-spondin-like isoform X1 n=1 Tax=Falco rusticolus TaxID=120794 RepID=UPI00188666F7|nr:SCO-spondin-like isoform X1 [Falco rusticolus]XP_037231088.1 SCO-spondin-like isoform X1 [Falco rusticolus]